MTIKVFPRGRVEVVVPHRTRAAEVQAFVRENAAWIRDARHAFSADHPPEEPEEFALPKKISLPGIGRSVRVRYEPKAGARRVRRRATESELVFTGWVENEKLCLEALRRWLASVAKERFEPELRSLARGMGTPFRKLQVRAQRTCWGSRSSTGTISLNFCLLFLDPALVRYLMIHELSHGRYMNHSERYWRFVARFEPDYRRLDRALTESWREVPGWLGIY